MDWWIKLHRKILDNPVWKDSFLFSLLCYLLLKVNFQEKNTFYIWNEKIILNPWQWILSQKKLSQYFKKSIWTISWKLKILKLENIIEIKTTNKYTLITFINRETYQWDWKQNWKQNENKMKTDWKQIETIKNNKEIKEYIYNIYTTQFENFKKNKNNTNNKQTINNSNSSIITKNQNLIELKEFVEKRNKVNITSKKKLQPFKNLPKIRKITEQLKKKRIKTRKEYTIEEIKTAVNNYIEDIENRNYDETREYHNHRFTLDEFLSREKWLNKFINL